MSHLSRSQLIDSFARLPKRLGRFTPVIDSTFPLHEAARAHARMAMSEHSGKIVLVVRGAAASVPLDRLVTIVTHPPRIAADCMAWMAGTRPAVTYSMKHSQTSIALSFDPPPRGCCMHRTSRPAREDFGLGVALEEPEGEFRACSGEPGLAVGLGVALRALR